MWLLRKLSDGSVRYLISENKTYTIGRKNCDIVLEEDASISRKHCTIYLAKQNECPFRVHTLTGIWVVDEKSKYGTYLKSNSDWIQINPNQNRELTSGSVIKFGLIDQIWSLEFRPIIACTSGIQAVQKKNLETALQSIDCCLKNSWCKECSLVIVNEITLTIKVVLALINGVPIVTPKYIEKVAESIKNQSAFPAHEDYRPAIKESILDVSLVSLDSKKNRKELFKGKKFVFPTRKQLDTLREVITSAGGTVELYSAASSAIKLAEENTVVIQLPLNSDSESQALNKSFKEVTSILKSKYERRVVPESEIAQAIAYSSVEKYCNPRSVCFTLSRSERQVNLGVSLVQETPPITRPVVPEPCVVPSSATIDTEAIAMLPSQSSESKEKQESQKFVEGRKRIHSQDQLDEELKAKKARGKSPEKPKESTGALGNAPVVEKKSSTSSSSSSKTKKGPNNMADILSFFSEHNKLLSEEANQGRRKCDSDFWNEDIIQDDRAKRKFRQESDDAEKSNPKRAKIRETNEEKQSTSGCVVETPREVVEVVETVNKPRNLRTSFPLEKVNTAEEETDFSDYIEKEKMDTLNGSIDEMNRTIFSLSLISSVYLKDDGSLIDPPSVPVNVKRFKKQKINSVMIVASPNDKEEDLSDGDWLEPHSRKHDISVGEGDDW